MIQMQTTGDKAAIDRLLMQAERVGEPVVTQRPEGPVTRITTPQGATISGRAFSSEGSPTLQITQDGTPQIKLRFQDE